ncbi:MAG: ABC transporter permease [Candidatus Cloacimonetes bacterium]|nr:ABC transporter permease [Candidatus Cloacimonadota bacterium]
MINKTFPVIKREYMTRVKTKGFIIGTLLFPVLMFLIFGSVFIFGSLFQSKGKDFVVIDCTSKIFNEFVSMRDDKMKDGTLKFRFKEYNLAGATIEKAKEELGAKVLSKELDGYFIIPEDIVQSKVITYYARNVSDFEEMGSFNNTFSWIISNMRLADKGYPADEIRKEMAEGKVSLQSVQVTEKGDVDKDSVSNFLLTYLLSYILFIFIMSYGQTVTRSVIEEKSQRITETIISSIKPLELMMGKLVGICLVGITQLTVIAGMILAVTIYGDDLLIKAGVEMPKMLDIIRSINFSPALFGFFIAFFLFGYLIYGSIFAAIGAMVNTEDEGQQFLTPVVMLNLASFLIMIAVAKNPDTTAAFWVSLVPFFTPVVMFSRISASAPVLPSGAILSLFTTAASVYLMLWVVAKIYRVGILMYGKKPNLKEVAKWLRY